MGVHSAIFGPSKYGLLPELLPERKLSWGNGVLELGTFVSIIGGTVAGAWLCKAFAGRQAGPGVVLIALAGFGLCTSFGISKVPAADPAKKFRANFLADLWAQIKLIRKDRVLWLATLGNTYFFALAALIQFLIVIYAQGRAQHFRSATSQLSPGRHGHWHRSGQFCRGVFVRRQNRIRPDPAGFMGMTVLAALLGRRGSVLCHRGRWICRCWVSSAGFSSCPSRHCSSTARTRKAKAECWRRPICFRLWAFSRRRGFITW